MSDCDRFIWNYAGHHVHLIINFDKSEANAARKYEVLVEGQEKYVMTFDEVFDHQNELSLLKDQMEEKDEEEIESLWDMEEMIRYCSQLMENFNYIDDHYDCWSLKTEICPRSPKELAAKLKKQEEKKKKEEEERKKAEEEERRLEEEKKKKEEERKKRKKEIEALEAEFGGDESSESDDE